MVPIQVCATNYQIACSAKFTSSSAYNFTILSCLFFALSYSGSGDSAGAISISASANLTVYSSIFSSIYGYTGGGIYFYGLSNSFFDTCAYDCFSVQTSNVAQFIFSTVSISSSMFCCSICQCSNSTCSGYRNSFIFYYGAQAHNFVNSSNNKILDARSTFVVNQCTSLSCSFLNIASSTSVNEMIMLLSGTSGTVDSMNFVNMTKTTTTSGIIDCDLTSLTISNSVFLSNSGGVLFYSTSGTLNVVSSWVSHSGYSIVSSGVITVNVTTGTTATLSFATSQTSISNVACAFIISNECETSAFTKSLINLMLNVDIILASIALLSI